jgi:hypothetical protein
MAAFRARSRRKNFDLGLITLDVDCALLGFMPPDLWSFEVSYKKDNLSFLDSLLGPAWDVHSQDGKIQYVTSIKFKVSSQLTLTGSVCVADYESLLPSNVHHRNVFAEHMAV